MSFQIGDSIGDYQIIGVLGAGGMGKVYKVKNTISDRVDALKILLPNLADDPELADRFTREIKVLASLNHPNIAGLRTAFRQDNQLLMVMEYVEGTTLDDRTKSGAIPVADAINYIMQALSALGYAHKHGVIHRDIKPANMMLTPDGVIKLMDFGIAKTKSDKKLTQTGTTMGSLFYMSAEQVQGNELDGRSDLYSVGVSLYEMVTGSRPFQGKSDFDIMVAQLQQVPQPPIQMMPDLPRALNDIIMISLEKDPAKRFQTAEAFAAALGSIGSALQSTPAQAVVPAPKVSPTGTQIFGTVPAAYGGSPAQGSATSMMGAQTTPAPPATGGFLNTASTPTVLAPQQTEPAAAPLPPTVPSHGVPPPQKSKSHAGLYMTLGALIVVAVLAVAAVEGTRFLKARANGEQSAQVTTTDAKNSAPPAATSDGSAVQPAGTVNPPGAGGSPTPDAGQPGGAVVSAGGAPPVTGSAASPNGGEGSLFPANPLVQGGAVPSPSKKGSKRNSSANMGAGGDQNVPTPEVSGAQVGTPPTVGEQVHVQQPPTGNTPPNAQELTELADQHDKLSARAQAVNDSVEGLRKQMAQGGNNLRPDITASQSRMKMYMQKFEAALNAGDADGAKRNMDLAEREVDKLEAFFNH